jgi:hypothetical protein
MAWQHSSVRALGVEDPVAWVTEAARALVYEAIEGGAEPPFDPMALAELRHIPVLPSQDVLDAALVPRHGGGVAILFNPNRPASRVRYSIAHELGHALFPDHAKAARHRLAAGHAGEDRELEVLCNLAAAEILMPVGSFPELRDADLTIDAALDLRAKYDVSTEAVLLRIGRLATSPVSVFAASPRGETAQDRYQVDYVMSNGMSRPTRRGDLLPPDSVVSECTAIGFTARGIESWSQRKRLSVECVGIPPYPGSRLPRVAGLLREVGSRVRQLPHVQYLVGNALEPRGKGNHLIGQVVNDKTANWGGGGFAVAVRRQWPEVQAQFKAWAADRTNLRLGAVHIAEVSSDLAVVSMIAQHGYGPSPRPRIRYAALEIGLEALFADAHERHASVHVPRLGAGEAGGSWSLIEELLNEKLVRRGIEVTVYDLQGTDRRPSTPFELQLALELGGSR